jgi:hypothetical protein
LTSLLISGQSLTSSGVRNNLSFYSYGGGGGCGTCDSDYRVELSNKTLISCGFQPDDDSAKSGYLVADFQKYVSKFCQKVSVIGGGGKNVM